MALRNAIPIKDAVKQQRPEAIFVGKERDATDRFSAIQACVSGAGLHYPLRPKGERRDYVELDPGIMLGVIGQEKLVASSAPRRDTHIIELLEGSRRPGPVGLGDEKVDVLTWSVELGFPPQHAPPNGGTFKRDERRGKDRMDGMLVRVRGLADPCLLGLDAHEGYDDTTPAVPDSGSEGTL